MKRIQRITLLTFIMLLLCACPVLAEEPATEPNEPGAVLLTAPEPGETPAESCDPRPDEVSEVREQFWGTCWDFGGMSTFESYLITHDLADTDIDLSEEDVLWWANVDPEGYGWTNRRRNDGGYGYMTAGYLMTVGARTEEDIPYLGSTGDPERDFFNDIYEVGDNQRPENYFTASPVYEVTDIAFYDDIDMETVKSLIKENGAVTATYRDDPDYFREDTSAFWFNGTEAEVNHTISVVGWDDDFPRENFKDQNGSLPEANGAWLIKNSYGTSYGSDGGFIWISYEDTALFSTAEYNPVYSVVKARKSSERKTYAHDEFGAVTTWSPGEGQNPSETFANIYDFGPAEKLTEITFMTESAGNTYDLYYAPLEDGIPDSDRSSWIKLSEGTVSYAGYTTVALENQFNVPEGKGAIIAEFTGENPGIGTDENLLHYGRPLFNAKISDGAAYYLLDGQFVPAVRTKDISGWTYQEHVDYVLRAYTMPAGPAPEPDPEPIITPNEEPLVTSHSVPTGDTSHFLFWLLLFLGQGTVLCLKVYKKNRTGDVPLS